MIYYTGDPHGEPKWITRFCDFKQPSKEDIIVVLGDVGANYFGDARDLAFKETLNQLDLIILCVHGNHEMRPHTISSYRTKMWHGGLVWYEETFPNLLFAKDGEIYDLEGLKHLVISGAYSVDKYYRLARGYHWWPDEQPSDEIKSYVEQQITSHAIDVILSHTCPYKYIPTEAFLPMIEQDTVDNSTERWLDTIEERVNYKAWFCGHWHINKSVDRMHFLFHHYDSNQQI